MSNELQASATSGLTLYAVLFINGQAWNGSALEAISGANWTNYDITMTEAAAGIYFGDMPAVSAGVYSYNAYSQAGANPATTDTLKGTGFIAWDGSAEIIPAQATTVSSLTAAQVWAYASRTLTQSAAQVADIVSGSSITIQRGDTLTAALTGLGAITGYTTLDFTVKANKNDVDTNAIIRIRKNASGSGDGLLCLNGATATATDGSITINDAALGNVTINLAAADTLQLIPGQGYYYDIQKISAAGVLTMTTGAFNVAADVTRLIV